MSAVLPACIDYPHGITCIDTEQGRAGLACCYLVRGGDAYAFIECGTSLSVPGLLAVLDARGIRREQIAYVIPTHVHLDHAGGAGRLLRECPAARLVVHPRGARHLIDPSALIAGASAVYGAENMPRLYGTIEPVAAERVVVADDGHRLALGDRLLDFIDAPGHARHHFAIWDAMSRGWFTGDTFGLSYRLFDGPQGAAILPTTTPVQFEPQAWVGTIARFLEREPACMYLTHYGRVEDVPRLAADLVGDLALYQSIALHLAEAPDRHARIVDALMLHALEDLAASGVPVDDATARDWLALDIDLSAQGLEVWLERQARATA